MFQSIPALKPPPFPLADLVNRQTLAQVRTVRRQTSIFYFFGGGWAFEGQAHILGGQYFV